MLRYHASQKLSFGCYCLFKLQDYVLYMPEISDLGADSTGAFLGEATIIKIRECPIACISYSEEMQQTSIRHSTLLISQLMW